MARHPARKGSRVWLGNLEESALAKKGRHSDEDHVQQKSCVISKKYEKRSSEVPNIWYKNKETDTIWWKDDPTVIGVWIFSFDKTTEFNMFHDYPYKLTKEQKQIFDKENPEWADFFKDRKQQTQDFYFVI